METVSARRRSAAAAHPRSGLLAKRLPPRSTPARIAGPRPGGGRETPPPRPPPAGVRGDEGPVDTARLDDALRRGLERRPVGADGRLDVEVRARRAEEQAPPVRRPPEAHGAEL